MTTHIFVAMGMWDEVVAHNELAAGPDRDHWRPGHYTWWLGYGYLQQGRWRDAELYLESMRNTTGSEMGPRATLARMRAEFVANTRRWDHPSLAWEIPTEDVRSGFGSAVAAADDWIQGRVALERGDPDAALAWSAALDRRRSEAEAMGDPNDPTPGAVRVMGLQLQGLVARSSGRSEEGVALLREALELERSLPFEFGPPLVVIPSGELLGEVLLSEGRAAEAARSFRLTLEVAPGRWTALEGLARAQETLGDQAAATRIWQELARHWHRADPELSRMVRGGTEGR